MAECRRPRPSPGSRPITLAVANESVWSGYGAVPDQEAVLSRYQSLVDALLDSPALTGFCYTQLGQPEGRPGGR
jgi:hypothetical protein